MTISGLWADLYSIAMLSPAEGWAVGQDSTYTNAIILRYTGGTWSVFSRPSPARLWSVSMVSATDGWAVGDGGAIMHYNGSTWQSVTSPTTQRIYGLDMVSSGNG